MFGSIASRYDLLNRLMTGGQDIHWRRLVIARLDPKPGKIYLDIGAGTGDLAFTILERSSEARVIAADFTLEMVQVGKNRHNGDRVSWVIADARDLPFKTEGFDGVVSGFLLRNVPDPNRALHEQARVAIVGGRVVSLDTTPPQHGILYPFIWIYLRFIIPAMGRWIAGNSEAYRYLPDSTIKFITAEKLAELFETNGLKPVNFVRKMFGTMAIHWAQKAEPPIPRIGRG